MGFRVCRLLRLAERHDTMKKFIFIPYVFLFVLTFHGLYFLAYQFKVVAEFLHLAVHLIDEAVAFL